MNPLHLLPQVALNEENESDVFSPTLLTNYDTILAKMTAKDDNIDDKQAKDVERFVNAIVRSKVSAASSLIRFIYTDKQLLVKTLLETAMQYIPARKALVVNSIFKLTDPDMTPLSTIIAIRLLCQANKEDRAYVPVFEVNDSIEEMIEKAGSKCNDYYLKLKYCDKKYWTYPLHLLANAKDDAGEQFSEIKANEMDIKRAKTLETNTL